MTDDTDPVADGLRRALEAAELANDAAEDVSRLGAAHKAFSERMIAAQKRTTALAGGALMGAVVALGLASLVYFRSVADLHEAAELQAEAAKLIVEEVLKMKENGEEETTRAKAFEEKLDDVAKRILDGMAEARQAAPEDGLAETLTAEMKKVEESILAALAEVDLGAADPTAVTEALARIEAGLLRATAAPAAPKTPPASKPAPAQTAAKPASKPRAAAAPEPNAFAFP